MLIKNSIFFYPYGYTVANGASCLDLPIAIATGAIFREDYYKYLFTLSFNANWEKVNNTWFENRAEILSNMNYTFLKYNFTSWKETLAFIYQTINEKGFVLMPVTYNALFYYLGPKSPMTHMILINGYDQDDDILLVNDCNFVNHGLEIINKEYTFYQVALHTHSIERIWNDSITTLKFSLGEYCLYSLQEAKTEHLEATSYMQMFFSAKFAPNNLSNITNQYRAAILDAYTIPNDAVNDFIFDIRRKYLGWLHPFFDYFNYIERDDIKVNIKKLADNLYKIRHAQITKIHMRLLRKNGITQEYIMELMKESESIENDINQYLKSIYIFK
ncbi:MAG: hypothetical protein HFH85_19970 [Lachnospiraceae bacterium]|jgi:hypothetical protein|nr:hypothetical protein [Lachnospiraceae bacterium]